MGPIEAQLVEAHRARRRRLYQKPQRSVIDQNESAVIRPLGRRKWRTPNVRQIDFRASKPQKTISLIYDRIQHVIAVVSIVTGITRWELFSKSRTIRITTARWAAMYFMRKLLGISLPRIGRALGGMDHTTCMHGLRRINVLIDTDENIAQQIAQMQKYLER